MKDVFSLLSVICILGFAAALGIGLLRSLFIPAHRRNRDQAMGDADWLYYAKLAGIACFFGIVLFSWLAEK